MRIILLGAPGSGKGTQAQRLQKDLGLPQISTGDLLRKAAVSGSEFGLQAKMAMDAGELVSNSVVLEMMKERLSACDVGSGYVLDGFPRNQIQAEGLDTVLSNLGQTLDAAVFMDVSHEVLMKRLTGRRTCSKTGKLMNIHFSSQQDLDECIEAGGTLIRRDDDNEDTIRNRLEVYERETEPLITYYRKCRLLQVVEADTSADKVYTRLRKVLVGSRVTESD